MVTSLPGPIRIPTITPSPVRFASFLFSRRIPMRLFRGWRPSFARIGSLVPLTFPASIPRIFFYNMGAVLLCTKCFAVHKPGQLQLYQVVTEQCEGASRGASKERLYVGPKVPQRSGYPSEPLLL